MSAACPTSRVLHTLAVDTGTARYEIVIGCGLLAQAHTWGPIPASGDGVIVTNPTVARHWAEPLRRALASRHTKLTVLELPDGEAYKDWSTLNRIFDHLIASGCDRRTVLYALGGGVVGDIVGFAAGCYMRGVPFVQVPTTLLAQVDSSVGGKTAINHPLGKNMIGLFNQPLRVVCDLDTLGTLPEREYAAGLAEVVKYGPIADSEFLQWLETHAEDLWRREPSAVAHAVRRSCEIKAAVVGQDERESGLREILNFGHTFGHAIEAGAGYGNWLHGEAVACGMLLAADLSARLGMTAPTLRTRLAALLQRFGLPLRPPRFEAQTWLDSMRRDKKTHGGQIRFVLIDGLGRATTRPAPEGLVLDVLREAGAC